MTLLCSKSISEANEACLLYIDCRQARMNSSSLVAVLEALVGGEGSRTMRIGSMGGWIHTGLGSTFAGDLNICRGRNGATSSSLV
jgi:hypothetical protein